MRVQQDKGYINMDEKIVFRMSLIFEVPPAMCKPTHSVTIWALSQEYLSHNIGDVAGVRRRLQSDYASAQSDQILQCRHIGSAVTWVQASP